MSKNRLVIVSVMVCFLLAMIPTALCATPEVKGQPGAEFVYISDMEIKGPLSLGEWVKITNKGTTAVNLKGWEITDEYKKYKYVFPSYILKAKSTVILYTGQGENTANALFWGMSRDVWNDGGDTAYLFCSLGKLMSTLKK